MSDVEHVGACLFCS